MLKWRRKKNTSEVKRYTCKEAVDKVNEILTPFNKRNLRKLVRFFNNDLKFVNKEELLAFNDTFIFSDLYNDYEPIFIEEGYDPEGSWL